jgi:hypothetical protein
MDLTIPTQGIPDYEQARMAEAARREMLLTGRWQALAEERLAEEFHQTVIDGLPSPEISRNPFRSLVTQISDLYHHAPSVRVEELEGQPEEGHGYDALKGLLIPELWPTRQQAHQQCIGMNEALVAVSLVTRGGKKALSLRVVSPSKVSCEAAEDDPQDLRLVVEYRQRTYDGKPVGSRDVWDMRGATPRFAIEIYVDNAWQDVTQEYMPDLPPGAWPYLDRAGQPLMRHILYHSQVPADGALWHPDEGSEMVEGTLSLSSMWTYARGGLRDAGHPQRGIIDGIVVGGVSERRGATLSSPRLVADRNSVLQIQSGKTADGTPLGASTFQWQPAMDPKSTFEALDLFARGMTADWYGISPQDLEPAAGSSGYALVVRDKGKQKARDRQIPSARLGDQQLLSLMARYSNAYMGTNYPEDPAAYSIEYPRASEPPSEYKERVEAEGAAVEAGLRHPVHAWMAVNGVSEDEAREQMMDAARFKAELAAVAATPETPGDAEDYGDMTEEVDAAIQTLDAADGEAVDAAAIRATLQDIRARMGPVNAG